MISNIQPLDYTIPYNPNERNKQAHFGFSNRITFPNTGDFVLYGELDINAVKSGASGLWNLEESDAPSRKRRFEFIHGMIFDHDKSNGPIGVYKKDENIQLEFRGDSDFFTYAINGKDVSSYPRDNFEFANNFITFDNCTGNLFSIYSGEKPDITLTTNMSGVGQTGQFWIVNNESSGTLIIDNVYLDSGSGAYVVSYPGAVFAGGGSGFGTVSANESGAFHIPTNLYIESNAGTFKYPVTFADSLTGEWGEWVFSWDSTNRVPSSGELFGQFIQNRNTGVKIVSVGLWRSGTQQWNAPMYARVDGTGTLTGVLGGSVVYEGGQSVIVANMTGGNWSGIGGILNSTGYLNTPGTVYTGVSVFLSPTGLVSETGSVRASSVVNYAEYYPDSGAGANFVYQDSIYQPNCLKSGYALAFSADKASGGINSIQPTPRKFYYFNTGEWERIWGVNTGNSGLSNLGNTGIITFFRDAPSDMGGSGTGTFTGTTGTGAGEYGLYHTMTQFIKWCETGDTAGAPHPTGGDWFYEGQGAIYSTGCLYPTMETKLKREGVTWGRNRDRGVNNYTTYRQAIREIYPGTQSKLPCAPIFGSGNSGIQSQGTPTSIETRVFYTAVPYTATGEVFASDSGSISFSGEVTGSPSGENAIDIYGNIRSITSEVYTGQAEKTLKATWDNSQLIVIPHNRTVLAPEGLKTFTGTFNLSTGHDTGSLVDFAANGFFNTLRFENSFGGGGKFFPRYTGFLVKINYTNDFTTGTLTDNSNTGDPAYLQITTNEGVYNYPVRGIKV